MFSQGRMQIRHFRRFRQNGPFLAGDKNTVYQKHGLCDPENFAAFFISLLENFFHKFHLNFALGDYRHKGMRGLEHRKGRSTRAPAAHMLPRLLGGQGCVFRWGVSDFTRRFWAIYGGGKRGAELRFEEKNCFSLHFSLFSCFLWPPHYGVLRAIFELKSERIRTESALREITLEFHENLAGHSDGATWVFWTCF